MISIEEKEVLNSVFKFVNMELGFILDKTRICPEPKMISWQDLYFKNPFIEENLYQDLINKNNQIENLNEISENTELKFLDEKIFEKKLHQEKAKTFFVISIPGFCKDGDKSLVLVKALTESGNPNYSSIFFLQKSTHFWDVKHSYRID